MNLRIPVTIGYLVIYGPLLAFFLFVTLGNSQWLYFGVLCFFTVLAVCLARKVFKKQRISRTVTAIAASVFWIFYGIRLSHRVIFIIQEGGMERRDGYGSPMAFLLGMISEIFFLAFPALAFTLLSIFYKENKTTEPNQAVDLTICIVTDRAPSSTLRANADRRSP